MPAIQAQLPVVPTLASAGNDPHSIGAGDFTGALIRLLAGIASAAPLAVGTGGIGQAEALPTGAPRQSGVDHLGALAKLPVTPVIGPQTGTPDPAPADASPSSAATSEPDQAAQDAAPSGANTPAPAEPLPDAVASIATTLADPVGNTAAQPAPTATRSPHVAAKPARKSHDDMAADKPASAGAIVTQVVAAPVDDAGNSDSRTPPPADPAADAAPVQSATQSPRKAPLRATQPNPRAETTIAAPDGEPAKPDPAVPREPSPGAVTLTPTQQQSSAPPVPAVATPDPPAPAQSAGKPTPSTNLPTPATQVAPALVSVVQAANGTQHLTLRLQPAELGQVEVRVDRSAGSPVRVEIVVQRAETLTLLLRDQPQLQHALDQAGLPPEGRSLALHVVPAPPTSASSGMFTSLGQGGGNGHQPADSPSSPQAQADDSGADASPEPARSAPLHWLRAGLDITA